LPERERHRRHRMVKGSRAGQRLNEGTVAWAVKASVYQQTEVQVRATPSRCRAGKPTPTPHYSLVSVNSSRGILYVTCRLPSLWWIAMVLRPLRYWSKYNRAVL